MDGTGREMGEAAWTARHQRSIADDAHVYIVWPNSRNHQKSHFAYHDSLPPRSISPLIPYASLTLFSDEPVDLDSALMSFCSSVICFCISVSCA